MCLTGLFPSLAISTQAKTKIVDPEGRMATTAIGCQATSFVIRPATPPEDPVSAIDLRLILVATPFPNVAKHIVEPPSVWLFAAYGLRPAARVLGKPSDIVEAAISCSSGSGSAGVFPLRLTRQPVSVSVSNEIRIWGVIIDDIRG